MFDPNDFPENRIEVWCVTPYPTPAAYRTEASLRHQDERWHWLTLSLKRGEKWTAFDGKLYDPATSIGGYAARVTPRPVALAPDVALVPVPRSSLGGGTWPGEAIAKAIATYTGQQTISAVTRTRALPSSFTSGGSRGNTIAAHRDSLSVGAGLPGKIALVDDAIASGTQMVGAREALLAAGYAGEIFYIAGSRVVWDQETPRDLGLTVSPSWFDVNGKARR